MTHLPLTSWHTECPYLDNAHPKVSLQISLASFPGFAQLFIACSTVKRGEPGIFSHVSMMLSENSENLPN